MNQHVASVHKEKNLLRCEICDYSCSGCSYIGNMKKHVTSVHEERKRFKCDICDAKFTQNFSLKKHIKTFMNKRYQRSFLKMLISIYLY